MGEGGTTAVDVVDMRGVRMSGSGALRLRDGIWNQGCRTKVAMLLSLSENDVSGFGSTPNSPMVEARRVKVRERSRDSMNGLWFRGLRIGFVVFCEVPDKTKHEGDTNVQGGNKSKHK
jgi:hypothetical protein